MTVNIFSGGNPTTTPTKSKVAINYNFSTFTKIAPIQNLNSGK